MSGDPRRTAVLVGITEFGNTPVLDNTEPDPYRLGALPFGADLDILGGELAQAGYQVRKPKSASGGELDTAEIWPSIKTVIDEHGPQDALLVHVLSHGFRPDNHDGLYVAGADAGPPDESTTFLHDADIVEWLRDCARRGEACPYILFLLDMCYAGQAVKVDTAMRGIAADKVWILAASTADQVAFNARFTKATGQVLRKVRTNPDADTLPPGNVYLPLDTFGRMVRNRVRELAEDQRAPQQHVFGTELDLADDAVLYLPFFDNPAFNYRDVGKDAVTSLSGLPIARDDPEFGYFVTAARCQAVDGATGSYFVGRGQELREILAWLNNPDAAPIQLVTGRPGAGKSALVGVIVCAAHPALSGHARQLGLTLPATAPHRGLAAVHGRHRDVSGLVRDVAAQLFGADDISTVSALIQRIEAGPNQVVVIVDALDEAADPDAILRTLVLPLTVARNAEGRSGCRVLLAARAESVVTKVLRQRPSVTTLDLDQVDPETLRSSIEDSVRRLLTRSADYRKEECYRAREVIADGIARRLVAAGDKLAWGAFLVARLYTDYLLSEHAPVRDTDEAHRLAAEVPLDVITLFERDMTVDQHGEWVRPVLAALALSVGYGMPAQLVGAVAAVCTNLVGRTPSDADVVAVLTRSGRYLSILPGAEGVALYRMFHDSLADHLRSHPLGAESSWQPAPEQVYHALRDTVPRDERGVLMWDKATSYVRRHVLGYARGADCQREILGDAGYLLSDQPEPWMAMSEATRSGDTPLIKAAITTVTANNLLPADLPRADRLRRLAIVAADAGSPRLARSLTHTAGSKLIPIAVISRPAPATRPTPALDLLALARRAEVTLQTLSSHETRLRTIEVPWEILTMTLTRYGGDVEVVTGSWDGVVRVYPASGQSDEPRLSLYQRAGIAAIAVTLSPDAPVLAVLTDKGLLHLWDYRDGTPLGRRLLHGGMVITDSDRSIRAFLPLRLADGTDALLVESQTGLGVIGLGDDTRMVTPNRRIDSGLATVYQLAGKPTVLLWTDDGAVVEIDPATGQVREHTHQAPSGRPRAITALETDDPVVVMVDDRDDMYAWSPVEQRAWKIGVPMTNWTVTALAAAVLDGVPVVACGTAEGMVGFYDPAARTFTEQTPHAAPLLWLAAMHLDETPGRPTDRLVAVDRGFGGIVIAEALSEVDVRIVWVSPAEDAGTVTHTVHTAGPVSELWLLPKDGWTLVAVAEKSGRCRLWHPVSGELLAEDVSLPTVPITRSDPATADLLYLAEHPVVVEGTPEGTIELRDLSPTPRPDRKIGAHGGAVTALAAWQRGSSARAVSCAADATMVISDLDSGTQLDHIALSAPAEQVDVLRGPDTDHLVVRTETEVLVFEYLTEPETTR